MAKFEGQIAEAVKKELLDTRFQSARSHAAGTQGGRTFFVLKAAATNYTQFAADHPDYKSADGVVTIPAVYNTIDAAIGACTDSQGDVIYVMPYHTETVTAAIAADIIGVSIIGLKAGNARPVITPNGTIDAIAVSAAGVTIQGLEFAAPGTTSQTADINIAAARCTVKDTLHVSSQTSKIKVDTITIAAGGDYFVLDGVQIFSTVETTCTSAISIEAAVIRGEIKNCFIAGEWATGALMDEATALLLHIHHNTFKNVTAAVACVTFTTGNSTGVMEHCFVSGRHTTIASNLVEGTGMDFHQVYVVEQAALNGLLEPAVDAE